MRPSNPAQGGEASLSFQNARFAYEPRKIVVQDFTARLSPGELCALIGPNAAGKSTLLRLAMGQLTPTSGTVTLDGVEVCSLKPRQRAKWISYVPQRPAAGFAFTVEQVVAMGRFALPANWPAVDRAMQSCDLAGHHGRVYTHLSAGQQQRVVLARSLAQSAGSGRIMLLDEPGSAMDLWHVHHTMRLLRERSSQGLAVLVVLHDLNLAAAYADVVWLMDSGRLMAAGPWEDVLRPQVLEPVYRIALRAEAYDSRGRPLFRADPEATLLGGTSSK